MTSRILAVDDDEFILKLVSVTLSQAGYQVFTATDGAEALNQISSIQPDLVILDVRMPGMTGYQVCQRLRSRPKFSSLPVLMLTANDTLEQKIKGFEAGTDDYMIKPFQPAELTARVQVLLRRKGLIVPQSQETASIESQIIGVFSLRGGVGVSTLAINLALGLTQIWNLPTTLVDMSFTCGQSALMLDLPLRNTWADLVDVPVDELDRDTIMQTLLLHSSELRVLAAPPTPAQGEAVTVELVSKVFQILTECNHYLVLDLAHGFGEKTLVGLDLAHKVVLMVTPEIVSVYAAKRALEVFVDLGYNPNNISLVLNWIFKRSDLTQLMIEGVLGRRIDFVIPCESARLVNAINRGSPLVMKARTLQIGILFEEMAFNFSKKDHKAQPPKEPTPAWRRVSR